MAACLGLLGVAAGCPLRFSSGFGLNPAPRPLTSSELDSRARSDRVRQSGVCGTVGNDYDGQYRDDCTTCRGGWQMAAGDPQRVWFPEMLARLRCEWNSRMSFPALIELRDRLDAMLQQIRSERHIVPPVFRCPKCGAIGPSAEPHVSVRALILALGRFGITSQRDTKGIERDWAEYRVQNRLDLYGQAQATVSESHSEQSKMVRCAHISSTPGHGH